MISIHAPREGCDSYNPAGDHLHIYDFNPRTPRGVRPSTSSIRLPRFPNFNPRTPRGVRPASHPAAWTHHPEFQSTHPARGATGSRGWNFPERFYFNPRTPRGVRLISTSATRASKKFQSTHPARGATVCRGAPEGAYGISIHAPREGCDPTAGNCPNCGAISIHAPREGCDSAQRRLAQLRLAPFQSTHPARGATRLACLTYLVPHFNPRTPRGVRLWFRTESEAIPDISIHAPREGCDVRALERCGEQAISIHAPREGCDQRPDT